VLEFRRDEVEHRRRMQNSSKSLHEEVDLSQPIGVVQETAKSRESSLFSINEELKEKD